MRPDYDPYYEKYARNSLQIYYARELDHHQICVWCGYAFDTRYRHQHYCWICSRLLDPRQQAFYRGTVAHATCLKQKEIR